MSLRPGELLIHEGNWQSQLSPTIDGEVKMHGLNPRDFTRHPCGSIPGIPQSTVAKIPRSEWPGIIKELAAKKALLSDIRMTGTNDGKMIPSRDQNGKGYCWAHSSVSAMIIYRAAAGLPYVDLSAYAIACMIKNFRDEGGWNAESIKFLAERGCPSSQFWPQQSMSRSNDNPATWENAALHKATEWDDIPEGDFDLQMTYLLMGSGGPLDLNWWSHSIDMVDPVDGTSDVSRANTRMESGKLASLSEFDKIWEVDVGGGFGIRIWNSWGDTYGVNGMAVLTESKATNNGAICLRVGNASVV